MALLALVGTADAQQQRCQQVLPSDLRRIVDATGQEVLYYRNPVRFLCTDGVEIEADSAVMNSATQSVELVGAVRYRDGDRELTAEWARFLSRADELFARGSVVLTDFTDGSTITGDDFEYRRQTEQRPESRMIMRGERPHAVLRPAPAPGATEATSTEVWARRMEFLGETVFLAQTDVELKRGDMTGAAEHARFDQAAERMTLTGAAHVETDEYRLDGERIDARMQADVVQEVTSDRAARLTAEELTVRGERIRIAFRDGEPERVEAWTPADRRASDGEDRPARAVAISDDFRLRADSIDARSDNGRLRQVTAVGRAYGERAADTLSVRLPETIARDWIQGDTIIGYFLDNGGVDPVPTEDEPRTAVLDRIEVTGADAPALSLYRTEREGSQAGPSVNFMRARKITLFMTDGEVSRVEADGPLEGIYLDPAAPPRPDPDVGRQARQASR
jgi:lipopolysaccharide export system protein LptA